MRTAAKFRRRSAHSARGAALTGAAGPHAQRLHVYGLVYEHERVYEGYVFPLEAETAALRAAWMSDSVWDGTAAEAYAGGTGDGV